MSGAPRVLIVGCAGQVGRELQRSFAEYGEVIVADRKLADLSVPAQIRDIVRRVRPQVILNAAAYTAVDRAESEPERAFAINAEAPGVLAEEALRTDSLLIHYSTDYVFDGSKDSPWLETDKPAPLNIYGASTPAGEEAIRQTGGKYLIFRTSWVYGPRGNNFLFTMLRLGRERSELSIVDDQLGAPTTSIGLADATLAIVDGALAGKFGKPEEWVGLYHMTCSGSTSWCGFAREIFVQAAHLLNNKCPVVVSIPSSAYPTAAKRPVNSVLSNEKLHARFGLQLAPWQSALSRVVRMLPVE
jgi:dTDP-4-dehydrorhamnose reductase